jgi:hypothetical protein
MRKTTRRIGAIFSAMLVTAMAAHAQVASFSVTPSKTDSQIKGFDEPHWMYVNRQIVVEHKQGLAQDRHQLLLWLTGTGGKARGALGFVTLAANLGYHVVSLMYPDEVPASTCATDRDPVAFERFRMAIIDGGDALVQGGRDRFWVDQPDSIENRLAKLLQALQRYRPRENWAQFLNADGSIKWESIAVAGQSQGGGHAALIGIKHLVARVLCFGSPKDYSIRFNSPAAWYGDASATPKDRFFAFNHVQDPMGCTPQQLWQNQLALGLDAFGAPAQVDSESTPFHHTRILYTAYPQVTVTGVESDGAKQAHWSAIETKNADRWNPVWTYMLTEDAP